jgi:restriction endonuclease Mrr
VSGITGSYSADDLVKIIEVCSKSGVQLFKSGDLEVNFRQVHAPTIEPVFVPREIEEQAESQAREATEEEEVSFRKEQLEELLISDPARLEELIRSGDLVDEDS